MTNPGPVDLIDVHVVDEDAALVDPETNCQRHIGDLGVGEEVTYQCSVSGLDGKSPFENEACAVGSDENGNEVKDKDAAIVFPQVESTTLTTPPTTTPPTEPPTTQAPGTTEQTLPNTGLENEQLALGGFLSVILGLALLWGTGRTARPKDRPE